MKRLLPVIICLLIISLFVDMPAHANIWDDIKSAASDVADWVEGAAEDAVDWTVEKADDAQAVYRDKRNYKEHYL
jgi:hypothetical protein